MLIFVQVCRTINKNLNQILGSGRTNESNEIYKRSLCCKKKHLKKRAFEDHHKLKSSEAVYEKLTSSEAEDHQKLKTGS